jgi:hypothetical protein
MPMTTVGVAAASAVTTAIQRLLLLTTAATAAVVTAAAVLPLRSSPRTCSILLLLYGQQFGQSATSVFGCVIMYVVTLQHSHYNFVCAKQHMLDH